MKRITGLTIALALVLGIYVGVNHGDKVAAAMKSVKTEFRIAYVDDVLGADDAAPSPVDAGPTDVGEVRDSDH